jgi:hypothetical protein
LIKLGTFDYQSDFIAVLSYTGQSFILVAYTGQKHQNQSSINTEKQQPQDAPAHMDWKLDLKLVSRCVSPENDTNIPKTSMNIDLIISE